MKERTAALLWFVHGRAKGSSKPDWRQLREEWNAQYPDWAFESSRRMNSVFRRAEKTALGDGWAEHDTEHLGIDREGNVKGLIMRTETRNKPLR